MNTFVLPIEKSDIVLSESNSYNILIAIPASVSEVVFDRKMRTPK